MKKVLLAILVAVLAVALYAQTAGPKLSEVQQLKLDNLHLQKVALQQNMALLQQQYANAQQQLQNVDNQAIDLANGIIKEQKLTGYHFDNTNFTFIPPPPDTKPVDKPTGK